MYLVLAVASITAQIVGFLALGFLFYDLFTIPGVLGEQATTDSALVQRFMMETVMSYRSWLGVGVLGAIAAWLLILKSGYRARWYLSASRVLAWIWFPLFPVGTVLAVLVFSAQAAASGESQP